MSLTTDEKFSFGLVSFGVFHVGAFRWWINWLEDLRRPFSADCRQECSSTWLSSLSLPFFLSLSGVSSCRASPRDLRLQQDSLDFLTAWQLGSQNAKGEAARTRLSLKLALCNFCHPWLVRISRGVSSDSREREVVPTSWWGEQQIICSHL